MKIDRESLHKIAHLARIKIAPEDEKSLMEDMEQILSWVEKLDELDTEEVEPLTHLSFEKNIFREDEPLNSLSREEALHNAPNHDDKFFKVPKVIK